MVAAALTSLAAVAGLIANVGSLTDFMQPSLSGPWLLTLDIQHSSLKSYEGMSATFQLYLVQDAHSVTGRGGELTLKIFRAGMLSRQASRMQGSFSATAAATTGSAVATPQQ